MSTKESDVETVCSGVRYSNAHRTGTGLVLTAVGRGEVHYGFNWANLYCRCCNACSDPSDGRWE